MGESTEEKTKLTKQGVRDLNYKVSSKPVAVLEVTTVLAEEAPVTTESIPPAPTEP